MNGAAVLSECGTYRYHLRREWSPELGTVCWVMLNPSTADAERDDATVRKIVGFSRRWGYGAVEIVNLYAYRARDPKDLRAAERSGVDVVGPENDRWIVRAAYQSALVVVGWGAYGSVRSMRTQAVADLLSETSARCLGTVGNGQPRHPLMPSYSTVREPWEPLSC